jgi:hypothetical protein
MQIVPPFQSLMANLPAGREYHQSSISELPVISESTLASLRGPPESKEPAWVASDDSDSDDNADPVGAFPGTAKNYDVSGRNSVF